MPPANEIEEIEVEVVYALPEAQWIVPLRLARGASVGEAIRRSGLLERHPQINADPVAAGVFGHRVAMDFELRGGERVEVYRALTVDPKEARRRRVALRSMRKPAA